VKEKGYHFKQITFDALISSLFIAPGTIVSCLASGTAFGYGLLWALFLSYCTQILLQGQMIRLGIVTQKGYLRNFRRNCSIRWLKLLWPLVLVSSLVFSSCAYQSVNYSMFQAGIYCFLPKLRTRWILIIFAVLLAVLIFTKIYRKLEVIFIAGLGLISILFVSILFQISTDWVTVLKSLLIPTVQGSQHNWLCICSLIGTVVMPTVLFTASNDAVERWGRNLYTARLNTLVTTLFAGVISVSVVITAANNVPRNLSLTASIATFSTAFQTIAGSSSLKLLGFCLLFTSLASGLLVPTYCVGFLRKSLPKRYRINEWGPAVLIAVILIGGCLVSTHWFTNPVRTALNMLTANTLVLPLIPLSSLLIMNHRSLGEYRNSFWDNLITGVVFLLFFYFSIRSFIVLIN